MRKNIKIAKAVISFLLVLTLMTSMTVIFTASVSATGANLNYSFSGNEKDKAGYAQGTITLYSTAASTYYLYWANDTKALDGYYEIATVSASAGSYNNVTLGEHTAIPAGATKIIATTSQSVKTVSSAAAVYNVPVSKQLSSACGNLLYKFNSYSDIHIDKQKYFCNAESNWRQALKFGVDKQTDFIVSSGDAVTNAEEPDTEWDTYERILAESDYVNPVWESDGNHDMRSGVSSGLKSFVKASGTDSTIENYDANKPYYYVVEKKTGDVFIFMALEYAKDPSSCDEFSSAQMTWLNGLLNKYYGTGVNIYIIEHSPINKFGAGDRMSQPYYSAHLNTAYPTTAQFKSIVQNYKNLIWMSGHTHEDFSLGYNYSDENNTACHMIHNPSVAGTTIAGSDGKLDYNSGKGYGSQGYYVEAYDNNIVYYGADLTNELIYPKYCYIMDGARGSSQTDNTSSATTASETQATQSTQSYFNCPDTKRVYFSNSLNWQNVYCYSWSTYDIITCEWPGFTPQPCGYDNLGNKLYYCDIPVDHEFVIWNSGNNGYQTVDITYDAYKCLSRPSTTVNSKAVPVNTEKWTYGTYDTGDVNCDDAINIMDTTTIQSYLAEITELDNEQYWLADVDFDGRVSIQDATTIQKYIAQLLLEFVPKEKTSVASVASNNAESPVSANTFTQELAYVKTVLNARYKFSSYDQYQALKKYYYQYKNQTSVSDEATVVSEFEALIENLDSIATHIGAAAIGTLSDTYYFENTNNWQKVYCYAWTGSNENASWPGVAMQKVGTNYGHDVYGIKFSSAGQYANVIFNDGSNQTVDITLSEYDKNAFYLDGTYSGSKAKVGNFSFTSSTEVTTPTTSVTDNTRYALCYYNGTSHGWSAIDTFFTKQTDGTYALSLVTKNSDNISLNVFDKSSSTYNCVSTSTPLTYSDGTSNTYSLVGASSRGSSITISGLTSSKTINFVYNPTANTLKITCGTSSQSTTEPQTDSTTYTLYMAPPASTVSSGASFKANIKDSSGAYHSYDFVATSKTYNGNQVYKVDIVNPSYTSIIKIQYQCWNSSGTHIGQVVDERTTTLSYYHNKIMVCSSNTSGTLQSYS